MFGSSPIGQLDWGDRIWRSIPQIYREKDAENGDYFRLLIEAIADTFFATREKSSLLPRIRDAMHCEGGFTSQTLTITSASETTAEDSEDGKPYWTLYTSSSLLSVCPGWKYSGTRQGVIKAVSAIGEYVIVEGAENPTSEEDTLVVAPPSLLEYLAKDMGMEIDFHEPETYQRNLVERAVYWQARRGTEDGIILRSKMSGFNATVRRLFWITEWYYFALPAANTFEIPAGSGQYYTDIEPRFMRFDEVAADVTPVDDLPPTSYAEDIVVTAVTGTSPNWTLTISSPAVGMIGNNESWTLTLGANSYYVESFSDTEITVYAADHTPITGTYTLSYNARNVPSIIWRPAHKVRIELEIIEPERLSEPDFLEGALTRLIRKLQKQVPAHVEFAQIAFTLSPSTVVEIATSIAGYMREYDHYDIVEADVQPADTYTETEL